MDNDTLELLVGKSYRIDNRDMVYAGMVNENIFSIAHLYNQSSSSAYNLYFPVKSKTFNLENSVYEILSVKPMSITIRSLGRDKK